MHFSNSRQLLDSAMDEGRGSVHQSQGMRRNASGILAGQNIFKAGV